MKDMSIAVNAEYFHLSVNEFETEYCIYHL